MERKEEKRYSTGEFADFFEIKKDTLFYYDKIKLFCPAGVSANGYRFYTSSQIEPFRALLSLRELGVPIKTLQTYFKNPSPESLLKMTDSQLDVVEQEIKKLQKICRLLHKVSQATREAETAQLGVVKIEALPERFYLYSEPMEQTAETTEEHWSDAYEKFVREADMMGISYIGSVISETDLKCQRFGRVDRLFAEITGRKGTVRKGTARTGGVYAVCYHRGSYDSLPAIYPSLLREIHNMGYSVAGDAYEEYLIAETATNCREQFVTKISIAVEKGT